MRISNLEEAALLVSYGDELEGAQTNPRGFVEFDFSDDAWPLLAEYHAKDIAITSLREFSKAHKNLRTIITRLRHSEAQGNVHVEQSHRS